MRYTRLFLEGTFLQFREKAFLYFPTFLRVGAYGYTPASNLFSLEILITALKSKSVRLPYNGSLSFCN